MFFLFVLDSPASKRGKKNESSKSKDVDTVAPSLELQVGGLFTDVDM